MAVFGMTRGIRVDMLPANAAGLIAAGMRYEAGKIRSLKVPIREAIDEVIRPRIGANFLNYEAADKYKWTPLAEFSPDLPYRQQSGNSQGPLMRVTWRLYNVATSVGIWKFRGNEGVAFIDSLPGAEYGFYHESSRVRYSPLTNGRIPQREFLVVSEADVEEIREIIGDWVEDRLDRIRVR